MTPQEIKEVLEAGLPDAQVSVEGDGRHFNAVIISDVFKGKSILEQHKLVYGVLGDRMQSAIHAFSMKTYTKEEWDKASKLHILS